MVAAKLALEDAQLHLASFDGDRVGVSLGSALGGVGFAEQQLDNFHRAGLRGVDVSLALCVFGGAGSCNVAIGEGITGPVSANSNSCASGTIALGEALQRIRNDEADIMLAGGAEMPLAPLCFGAFDLLRAMSPRNDEPQRACLPFDRDRDGFVMAEGAAMMVVEELQTALRRGAHIYAELVGTSLTNDAHHMAAPRPDGTSAARAITLALEDARIGPGSLDCISAHGSSTPLNDVTETRAIHLALGERARDVPIFATKAITRTRSGPPGRSRPLRWRSRWSVATSRRP